MEGVQRKSYVGKILDTSDGACEELRQERKLLWKRSTQPTAMLSGIGKGGGPVESAELWESQAVLVVKGKKTYKDITTRMPLATSNPEWKVGKPRTPGEKREWINQSHTQRRETKASDPHRKDDCFDGGEGRRAWDSLPASSSDVTGELLRGAGLERGRRPWEFPGKHCSRWPAWLSFSDTSAARLGHHVKDPKPGTNATPYVPPSPQRLLSASYIMQAVKVAGGIQGQMLLRKVILLFTKAMEQKNGIWKPTTVVITLTDVVLNTILIEKAIPKNKKSMFARMKYFYF
ncbi:uncharacterized protein LOC132006436 [Mustela nigripes]|uniref:uncharacterized protein LOC132006436 n=1 Tax=Mustela nigripes TaxID=77151 RepID=UPI002814FB60|nr:uncharacterized protein LOC132006436 [Mustela nigripes]